MTAHDAFRLIVFNAFSHLTANDDCARLKRHIEGVHQCRVALRRLQSAFKIYRPLLRRKRIEPVAESVRWLGKILGAARDLDVLQSRAARPRHRDAGRRRATGAAAGQSEHKKERGIRAGGRGAVVAALPSSPDRPVRARARRRSRQAGGGRAGPRPAAGGAGLARAVARAPQTAQARRRVRNAVQAGTPRGEDRAQAAALRARFLRRRVRERRQEEVHQAAGPLARGSRPHERRRGGGDDARATGRRRQRWTWPRPSRRRVSSPSPPAAFSAGIGGGRPKSTCRWSRTGTPSSAPSRSCFIIPPCLLPGLVAFVLVLFYKIRRDCLHTGFYQYCCRRLLRYRARESAARTAASSFLFAASTFG